MRNHLAANLPESPQPVGNLQEPSSSNSAPGTVEFAAYAPKVIVLNAQALKPAVLLLNDHFDPNWQVRVDGKCQALLRCNYVVQGVFLSPGNHKVEFEFQQPVGLLYVSLTAIGTGLLLLGFLAVAEMRRAPPVAMPFPGKTASLSPIR